MDFGVISTANIGVKRVIPAIQRSEASVTAIASRDADRAQAVAGDLDIPRAYGSYEALLEDDDIDAVYIPLPNSLHAEWTRRAADAGVDILCEKPLGIDAEQTAAMVEYCDDREVTLMEAFMFRYHPRTERTMDIARTHLGSIRHVDAQFHFPVPEGYNIRLDPDLAGGSLMDVGCYAVTTVRAILGEPVTAFATATDRRDCGVDTHLTGLLTFEHGQSATVGSSFDATLQRYTVLGTNGTLTVDQAYVPNGETALRYTVNGRTVEERFDPIDQYQREVEAFVEAVQTDSRPRTDGSEAVKTMRVIDALYESAAQGAPVAV